MKSFNVNGVLFDEHSQNSDSKVVKVIINSKQNIVVCLQQNELPPFVEQLHYTS